MRVFSQINKCQQKKKTKQNINKSKKNKKGRALLLGLAKSIFYHIVYVYHKYFQFLLFVIIGNFYFGVKSKLAVILAVPRPIIFTLP